MREVEQSLSEPDEWLVSWGYHSLWHGPLDRHVLDEISDTRPIGVWQRSCHEWFMNSAATERLGVTEATVAGRGHASTQCDVANGHYWEAGLFNLLMPVISPILLSRERIERGLHQLVEYLRMNGVTAFNEPGIAWRVEPWDLYQTILGAPDAPFLSTFMVDGRNQANKEMDPADVVADAERQVARAPEGKVSMLDGAVKLFADGAIISQLIQMRDPFLDEHGNPNPHHHGEWIMEPEELRRYFRAYWEAGWQIHTHVNADRFSQFGLGPARADLMARNGSVVAANISLSFHSDLPMAPAHPLQLASFAVNRRTQSGRVAGPEQRITVDQALRAVTIDAAHSWRREHELGSIAPGKQATFTVLGADPYEVDPEDLGDIAVRGVIFRGEWHPVPDQVESVVNGSVTGGLGGGLGVGASVGELGCSCDVAQHLADAFQELHRRAA